MNQNRLLKKKIAYPLFAILGFLFVLVWKAEKDLAENGNILWDSHYTPRILGLSLVLGSILGCLVCWGIYWLCGGRYERKHVLKRKWSEKLSKGKVFIEQLAGKKVFLISFVCMLLSYLPAYLAYYPAICAYDTPVQMGQVFEGYFIDHHPIAHTLLLKMFISLGNTVFESAVAGVAIYAVFQMVLLSGAFSYGIMVLHQRKAPVLWQVLLLGYGMLYPFHWYMSVSVTKDTLFSGFFLVLMVVLCQLLAEGRNELKWKAQDFLLFVSIIGMILFRNNGKYAMMVLLVFAVFALWRGKNTRKFWGRICLVLMMAFLVGNLVLSGIFKLTGAEQGDRREMLSMPIQQFARCMIYHGGVGVLPEDDGTMDQDSKDLVNDFLLYEAYRKYDPYLADPVKSLTNTYVARYRAEDFIMTYLKLLTEYPGDFVNAGLLVNAGYLYPNDVSHAYINVEEGQRGRGYVQTCWAEAELNSRGIYKDSKWEGMYERLEDWADANAYLSIPVLKYIFVPGTYLWAYMLFAGVLLIQKKYRMLLPLSLVLGYYITLLLGPTVQLRYLYPVMIVLPFLLVLSMGNFSIGKEEGMSEVKE